MNIQGTHIATHHTVEDDATLLLRGYAAPSDATRLPDQRELVAQLCRKYLASGNMPFERLEGSFTIAVLDGRRGRLLLYRNLIGTGFTYYTQSRGGLLFGSNLAELVGLLDGEVKPNRDILPVYFLYRTVPGRQTLFDGIYRLMPGELLTFDAHGLKIEQRQTFADLDEPVKTREESVDRLEEVMGRIMADCAAIDPKAVNLLSGGVDSTYIQAHWNITPGRDSGPGRSGVVGTAHSVGRTEVQYARSAALVMKTSHEEFQPEDIYAQHLLDSLLATAEPPNHVQSAYFIGLARFLIAGGNNTGICGEGADSLFGSDYGALFHYASKIRRYLPLYMMQRIAAWGAEAFNKKTTARCLRLAGYMNDLTWREHPINEIAVFTTWAMLDRCFGRGAMEATSYRRRLMDQYAISQDLLTMVHAAGYLGEAMGTASLWETYFNTEGACLMCPFMDSRMLRMAVNVETSYRFSADQPKKVLKAALCRHVPEEMVYRPKLGFGQPVFEWLAPGGQLRPLVDSIGHYDFVKPSVLEEAKAKPNWFLYSLLCYDLWYKLFIEKSLAATLESAYA